MGRRLLKVWSVVFAIMHLGSGVVFWVLLLEAALKKADMTMEIIAIYCVSFVLWFPVSLLLHSGVLALNDASVVLTLLLINSILWAQLLYCFLMRHDGSVWSKYLCRVKKIIRCKFSCS